MVITTTLSLLYQFSDIFMSMLCFTGDEPADYYLSDLFAILSTVIASKPSEKIQIQEGKL